MPQDDSISLNQRSYLLDALKQTFKKIGVWENYNPSQLWEITGQIPPGKYKFLLSLYFQKNDTKLTVEVDKLLSTQKEYDGKRE